MDHLITRVIDEKLGWTREFIKRADKYLNRKLRKNQQEFSDSPVKQRAKLASTCFDWLAHINLIELVEIEGNLKQNEASQISYGQPRKNVTCLKLRNLFLKIFQNDTKNVRQLAIYSLICIYHIFVQYMVIKSTLIVILHYARDSKLSNYHQKNSTNLSANGYLDCNARSLSNKPQDIPMQGSNIQQLAEYTRLLTIIGDGAPIICGSSIVSYSTVVSVVFFYFELGIYKVYKNNYQLGIVNYLRRPVDEWQKNYTELMESIQQLMGTSLIIATNDICSNEFPEMRRVSIDGLNRTFWSEQIKRQIDYNSNKFNIKLREVQLSKRIIESILDNDLIKPSVLDRVNYLRMSKLYVNCSVIMLLVAFSGGTIFSAISATISINLRLLQRLANLRCLNLTEFKRDYAQIDPITLEDEQKYLSVSLDRKIPLDLYFTEARYYIYYYGYYLVEMQFFLIIVASSTSFYACIHLLVHYERIIWLNKMREKIQACMRSLYDYQKFECQLDESNEHQPDDLNDRKFRLIQSITAAFLEYESFRKQQDNFKSVSNFLSAQGAGLAISSMSLAYAVGLTFKADSALIMSATASFATCYLNFYILLTAIVTKRIDSLHGHITRLVALGCHMWSLKRAHIFIVWRKHLLDESETRKLLAPSILSIYPTYERLLTLNIYVLLLWYVLMSAHRNW